jgi:hypothetical protein
MAIREQAGIKVCGRVKLFAPQTPLQTIFSGCGKSGFALLFYGLYLVQLFKNHFGQQALMAISVMRSPMPFQRITTSFYRARNGKQMEFSLASPGLEMFIQAHARPAVIKTNSAPCAE